VSRFLLDALGQERCARIALMSAAVAEWIADAARERRQSWTWTDAPLWRWGRVELPVQGHWRDRVYERSQRFVRLELPGAH